MLVTLGDNDYTESPARFRENWRRSFGWARRTGLRVAGVLGNHDYGSGRPLPVPAARDAGGRTTRAGSATPSCSFSTRTP